MLARWIAPRAVRRLARGLSGAPPPRHEKFTRVTQEDVQYFKQAVGGEGRVVTDHEALEGFNRDWLGNFKGSTSVAICPTSTQQVSKVLSYCNERRLAVVPQGGNTGLVGGSVPVYDEVVLSTSAMNKIVGFDEVSGILNCQAGCILQALDVYLAGKGYAMPLDLGAKGSCQIGGNVSTNAGGVRLLRYGSLHGSVLGLEVVLADGEVLDVWQSLRKDNTGYDLKQLFIGAEGTLGVVTGVSLLCPARSASVQVSFLSCKSFHDVLGVFRLAKQRLGEVLSAVEFLDQASLLTALEHLPGIRSPLQDDSSPFYMLVETSGSNEAHDREKMDDFLEATMSVGLLVDGSLAQDASQASNMWRVREGVTEALVRRGKVYKYDVSLPLSQMYGLVEEMRARLPGDGIRVVGYGHVGDGNLHLNVSDACGTEQRAVKEAIEPFVYEWTRERRGSISAEHGLGLMKAECIRYSKAEAPVRIMGAVKKMFDPKGILNPYKVLPQDVVNAGH